MTFPACGGPSWLPPILLSLFLSAQLSTTCLAQSNTASGGNSLAPITSTTVVTVIQSSSASLAAAQTHTIQVGLADHIFKPDSTVANIGDIIEFDFYPLNHSVVRAEYGFPCIPYEMTGPNKVGFFSGFQAVNTVLTSPPTYRIRINDTNPVFFYCSAPGSCLNYGMVGAINPNASTSVAYQHQLALNSTYMLNPGEPFPAESPLPSNLPISSATAGLVDSASKHKKALSAGAIAGIAIGALSVIILAALLLFFWGRTKSLKEEVNRKAGTLRRLSPDNSSMTMLASSPAAGGHSAQATNGGVYQHYQQQAPSTSDPPTAQQHLHNHGPIRNDSYTRQNFSTPVPSYFAPHTNQPLKYDMSSPTGHPAYTPPPPSHNTLPLIPITAPFELSPTSHLHQPHDHRHNQHMHTSPFAAPINTTTPTPISSSPRSPLRSASPHCLASIDQEAKYGRGPTFGREAATSPFQQQQQHDDAIPSYFESVHRREPLFVNGSSGPVEMEASEVGRASTAIVSVGVTGGEVEGEEKEKEGGSRSKVDVVSGTTMPRWEEVTVKEGEKDG